MLLRCHCSWHCLVRPRAAFHTFAGICAALLQWPVRSLCPPLPPSPVAPAEDSWQCQSTYYIFNRDPPGPRVLQSGVSTLWWDMIGAELMDTGMCEAWKINTA